MMASLGAEPFGVPAADRGHLGDPGDQQIGAYHRPYRPDSGRAESEWT
jgi:hypothetical protein